MSSFEESLSASNNQSPFGEAGLYGDPLHYLVGSKYDKFMRKTWELPNQYIGKYLTKFDKFDRKVNPIHRAMDRTAIGKKIADYAHNKPGDSALAVLGSIFGGGALMGGGSSGGTGGGLGVFSNNGAGGMSQVGGGNLGNAVNAGSFTPMSSGSGMGGMQSQMRMPQQQQQQSKNTAFEDEMARQEKERELKKQIAQEMGTRYV